ncbi:uncharacterized protein [Mytilus edulis]|uniref:uncharacterized protein n=1 Tax=Mytilus edulis TaxID=6550 RepID=UPI0039EF9ECE
MLKLSCMKQKKYTEVIFKTLFQNCKIEFLHLNIALKTLLLSRDFDSLKILLCTFDTTIFDMNKLIEGILDIFRNRRHAESITKWLLQNFDPILFDISYILKKSCCADKLEFAQWLCRQFNFSNITLESVFIYACKHSAISVLQWLFEKISFPISFKEVIKEILFISMSVVIFFIQNFDLDRSDIDKLCRIYSREEVDQLEFQLCIFEAYGSKLVDVKLVFDSVCRLSSLAEVKWFMRIVDNNLHNFFSAIKKALRGNNDETFLFLFEFVKLIDLKEANKIFIKACYHGNLEPVKILHNKYGESLRISVAMKELCKNESITHKHFDVFKFLVSFSSPSIIDCQLLLNRACKSGDIENTTYLLYVFDPDIFEVRSAIHHAFDKFLSTGHKRHCEDITMLLLNRCQCTLSDIQAVMETVCSKGMVTLMKWLVLIFGPDSFDFRRILNIAISPINTEIFPLAFCQCRNSQIDLQNIIVSACKTGGNETLMIYIFFAVMVGLDQNLVVDTMHTILDIRCKHSTDITNEVIKFLFMKVDSNTVDFTSILKKSYTSGRNALVLWILKNIHHSLIDIQETLHEICRKGDIDSIEYLLHTRKYANLVNELCIHNAFSSGSFEMIKMLIQDFPRITIDTKVAMNNASSSGAFAVVQWLFYKYSICSYDLPFLEPLLDLKLARSVFDLNSAMLNACRNGNTDVVQWLLQLYSYETFDMRLSLIETSASGQADLVKWMLAVYDNDIFDIETSLISACKNGNLKVVQLFIDKFGIDAFHMETITTEACKSGNKKLVEWLHAPVSCELFEI